MTARDNFAELCQCTSRRPWTSDDAMTLAAGVIAFGYGAVLGGLVVAVRRLIRAAA